MRSSVHSIHTWSVLKSTSSTALIISPTTRRRVCAIASRTAGERSPDSLRNSDLPNRTGGRAPLAFRRSSLAANPFASPSEESAVSFPHRRLRRDTSVRLGKAANTGRGQCPSVGLNAFQWCLRTRSSSSSRNTAQLMPSTTTNRTEPASARGATTSRKTFSTATMSADSESDSHHPPNASANRRFTRECRATTCLRISPIEFARALHVSPVYNTLHAQSTKPPSVAYACARAGSPTAASSGSPSLPCSHRHRRMAISALRTLNAISVVSRCRLSRRSHG